MKQERQDLLANERNRYVRQIRLLPVSKTLRKSTLRWLSPADAVYKPTEIELKILPPLFPVSAF